MLKLIRIKETDLEMIMNWRISPEVTQYMYTDPKLTFENQKKWYEEIKNDASEEYWIIEFDNCKIGILSLTDIDLINSRCNWAYYIADTSYRGKGLARTLELNVYNYVLIEMGLNKLCCEVFAFNEGVVKLHKRYGSEVEGILKKHICKNDNFFDIVVMAVLKDKWIQLSKEIKYERIEIEQN